MFFFSFYHGINATHIRGGTISWKPIGSETEVINHNFNNLIIKLYCESEFGARRLHAHIYSLNVFIYLCKLRP